MLKRLLQSGWPCYREIVDFVRFAESEVQPQIILRVVARTAHHLVALAASTARDSHARANGRAIRPRSHTLDYHPVIPVTTVVPEKGGRPVQIVDYYVHVTVVVEISERATASKILCPNRFPGLEGNILEAAVSQVSIEDLGLPVRNVQFSVGDLRVDVAVGEKQVLPPIIIKIHKAHAEPQVLAVDSESSL